MKPIDSLSLSEMRTELDKAITIKDDLKTDVMRMDAEIKALEGQLESQLSVLRREYGASSLEELQELITKKTKELRTLMSQVAGAVESAEKVAKGEESEDESAN